MVKLKIRKMKKDLKTYWFIFLLYLIRAARWLLVKPLALLIWVGRFFWVEHSSCYWVYITTPIQYNFKSAIKSFGLLKAIWGFDVFLNKWPLFKLFLLENIIMWVLMWFFN